MRSHTSTRERIAAQNRGTRQSPQQYSRHHGRYKRSPLKHGLLHVTHRPRALIVPGCSPPSPCAGPANVPRPRRSWRQGATGQDVTETASGHCERLCNTRVGAKRAKRDRRQHYGTEPICTCSAYWRMKSGNLRLPTKQMPTESCRSKVQQISRLSISTFWPWMENLAYLARSRV